MCSLIIILCISSLARYKNYILNYKFKQFNRLTDDGVIKNHEILKNKILHVFKLENWPTGI